MTNEMSKYRPIVGTAISSFNINWDMGQHAHSGIELSVVLEGKGNFKCEGIATAIEKGDIILIQANVVHNYDAPISNIRFAVLDLQHMPSLFMEGFSELLAGQNSRILRFSKVHLEQYETIFRIWLRSLSEQTLENPTFITTWGNLLLMFIQQNARSLPALLSVSKLQRNISVISLMGN